LGHNHQTFLSLPKVNCSGVNSLFLVGCHSLATSGNNRSRRVLEKNGFVLEGTRIKHLFYDGKFYNQLDYGLLLSI